jgi:preprotein translocase subunit SecE
MNLTSAVIVMTVALSVFLGIIDTALDWIVKPLIGAK